MDNNTDVMQLFVVMATAIFGPSVATVIGSYICRSNGGGMVARAA